MTTQADCSGAPEQGTSLASQGASSLVDATVSGLPPETWDAPRSDDLLLLRTIRLHIRRCESCKKNGTACADAVSLGRSFEYGRIFYPPRVT